MCNIHCFSTATVVVRSRLSITLYVHCLSCFKIGRNRKFGFVCLGIQTIKILLVRYEIWKFVPLLSSDMKRGKILSTSLSLTKVRYYPLLSKVTRVPWGTSWTLRARKMRCCSQTSEMKYWQCPRRTDISSTTLRKPNSSLLKTFIWIVWY
jgi:hypothetical protein